MTPSPESRGRALIPLSRATVTPEMKQAMLDVVDSGRFILGPETQAFEKEFAAYIGTRHAIAVSQGTAAIQLSLQAIGIEPGGEVLVPSMTAFPTIEGVIHAGGTPVFVDNDRFGAMDPVDAARRITRRTVVAAARGGRHRAHRQRLPAGGLLGGHPEPERR